jgi:hypothetical protein
MAEVSFRIKPVFSGRDTSCRLVVYWKDQKYLEARCFDGADVLARAAHLFKAIENGVEPPGRIDPSEVLFRVRYSGDPAYPCLFILAHERVHLTHQRCPDGRGAVDLIEFLLKQWDTPYGLPIPPELEWLIARDSPMSARLMGKRPVRRPEA